MKTWFINIWSNLRSSYWFIPLVMAIAAILLAITIIILDLWITEEGYKTFRWLFIIRSEGARAILATIAGSMITVVGVTFSMSVLAVSFSMGQIGPRLIQNFMRDKANQYTIGIFIATFLYSILVLLTVVSPNESGENAFVPHVGLLIAIILAIICIGFFIFFIHHIPESINIFNLLAKISKEYDKQLDSIFPQSQREIKKIYDEQIELANFCENAESIFSEKNGYIRYIDKDTLFELAVKMDCIIAIKYQIGTFVTQETPLVYINKLLDETQREDCLDCFSIANEKDSTDDILFLGDEIVEIIARALSPGINAPFIAITAIDWLQVMIESFSRRQIPQASLRDKDNKLRIIATNITLADFIDHVFGGIRSYVAHDRNTLLHMLNTIKIMLQNCHNEKLNYLLKSHAEKFFAEANEHLVFTEDKNEAKQLLTKISKL